MDYSNEKISLGTLRRRFYDRTKEIELLDDCIGEALTKRAVPTTVALSASTYLAIREGFLRNNGIFGLMRKNFLCMCVGIGVSLIGIQSDYHDKLAIFYTSHRYQELRNMILANWREEKKSEIDAANKFVQPNHLNLDFERPNSNEIDSIFSVKSSNFKTSIKEQDHVTYEELQRKNREKYAIKHTMYY